jgi:hypothetical protein
LAWSSDTPLAGGGRGAWRSSLLSRIGPVQQYTLEEHAWFEHRAEKCTLLAFVDDATSRLMHLRFVISESAFDYFRATRSYLETHGKPVAFYSDKHSIFRVNAKELRAATARRSSVVH